MCLDTAPQGAQTGESVCRAVSMLVMLLHCVGVRYVHKMQVSPLDKVVSHGTSQAAAA